MITLPIFRKRFERCYEHISAFCKHNKQSSVHVLILTPSWETMADIQRKCRGNRITVLLNVFFNSFSGKTGLAAPTENIFLDSKHNCQWITDLNLCLLLYSAPLTISKFLQQDRIQIHEGMTADVLHRDLHYSKSRNQHVMINKFTPIFLETEKDMSWSCFCQVNNASLICLQKWPRCSENAIYIM